MQQPELTLYHFPGACSGVALTALEAAGLRYDLKLVDLSRSQQTSAEYYAISPLGKVPALAIDGRVMTENAAILTYVSLLRPEARLLGGTDDPVMRANAVGGMSFCSATLHPTVRGMLNPVRVTDGDEDGVRRRSAELAREYFAYADGRIDREGWWLGEWTVIDNYLHWAFSVARKGGLDSADYPALLAMDERLRATPGFERMRAINEDATRSLGL